jgi:hypothetical protein
MMGSAVLLCMLAASGIFDIWKSRYLKRKPKNVYSENQSA